VQQKPAISTTQLGSQTSDEDDGQGNELNAINPVMSDRDARKYLSTVQLQIDVAGILRSEARRIQRAAANVSNSAVDSFVPAMLSSSLGGGSSANMGVSAAASGASQAAANESAKQAIVSKDGQPLNLFGAAKRKAEIAARLLQLDNHDLAFRIIQVQFNFQTHWACFPQKKIKKIQKGIPTERH